MRNTESTAVLDCGHQPSPHSEYTTGYGTTNDGQRHCWECCARMDREALRESGRYVGYLTFEGQTFVGNRVHGHVTNWPGTLRFPVIRIKSSRGWVAGTSYQVYTGNFVGPDGYVWSFRNAGDSQLAHCKRTNQAVS